MGSTGRYAPTVSNTHTTAVDAYSSDWRLMKLASGCYELCGLGYIGVDMVLDQDKGPLILELNARPGLNIQIANDCGLVHRAHAVEARLAELKAQGIQETPEERMRFAQQLFGHVHQAEI
nr:sugar-transfer associated ATP-grasp domain-containing protein [Pseudomonas cavernicola]